MMTPTEVGECLDEMESLGRQIIKSFEMFFPEVNLTPWLFTLCIDCPFFARELYDEYGVGLNVASCQSGEL